MNNAVEQYIISQPKKHQTTLFALRQLVIQAAPFIEQIKWSVPFYSYKGDLCFISLYKKKQPVLAFAKGYLLSDEQGILTAKDRQYIRHLPVNSLADFYEKEETIREVLQEAVLLNEQNPNTNWKKL